MKNETVENIIMKLGLQPLEPEGGYFCQTYSSERQVNFGAVRPTMTAIYYLITDKNFSAFHRLKSDEIYHFYSGHEVELFVISEDAKLKVVRLGSNLEHCVPQYVVPAGAWQACRINTKASSWSLLGTTVSPGFSFDDFELGHRDELIKLFPNISDVITLLTRA